jgi:hypothetical protein
MSAHLVIQDGPLPYWWTSPDVWIVPGNDPNGTPGQPKVGQLAYLWSRVSNSGMSPAPGTRVDFYWANPSAQVAVGTAAKIGSAFVDLAPGDTQDVLCLVPWTPVWVNGGHECVIAVAHGPDDALPIPDPLPIGYLLDPPAHDQIAQVNIGVLQMSAMNSMAVWVNANSRTDKHALLSVEYGGELAPRLVERLGLQKLRPAHGRHVAVALSFHAQCGEEVRGGPKLEIEARRGTSVPVYASLMLEDLPRDHYQLVHLVERDRDRVVGGVSYVVINVAEEASQ